MNTFLNFLNTYVLIPKADAASREVIELVGKINEEIINPLIVLLFTVALILFIFGMYNFFANRDNSEDLDTGKRHMVWGIVGMAIMVSVFGIMNFITSSLGVKNVNPETSGDVSGLINTQ